MNTLKIVISPTQLFALTDEQIVEFARRKGFTLYPEGEDWRREYWLVPKDEHPVFKPEWNFVEPSDPEYTAYEDFRAKHIFDPFLIKRTDPVLVAIVEELRDSMLPVKSALQIIEIPADVHWSIFQDCDGSEHIIERSRQWYYDVDKAKTVEFGGH